MYQKPYVASGAPKTAPSQTKAYQGKPKATATKSSFGGGAGADERKKPLLSTGLFASNRPESKVLASVFIKEEITIPAGSSINLFEYYAEKAEEMKAAGKTAPTFLLQVREPDAE